MLYDLDLDDDFSDGLEKANQGKVEATDLSFEQESESVEFNANSYSILQIIRISDNRLPIPKTQRATAYSFNNRPV